MLQRALVEEQHTGSYRSKDAVLQAIAYAAALSGAGCNKCGARRQSVLRQQHDRSTPTKGRDLLLSELTTLQDEREQALVAALIRPAPRVRSWA